jgi:sugar/nucleoside kinase (ribokinase family)
LLDIEQGSLDLLVIGDCNPDVMVVGSDVTPAFGQEEKLVERISLEIGGSASITAVAAARLGLRVALAAAVGDDPAGRFMLGQLAAEGVDTSYLAVRDDEPTGMTVALSAGGDRAILTATGAVATLSVWDVPLELLASARHVHVSSYFLVAGSLGPGLARMLRTAQATGASTSLDTNWDPAQRWSDERLTAALAHVNLLLPNEAEALHLAGGLGVAGEVPGIAGEAPGGAPGAASLEQAVSALTAAGPRLVVKLGERGALCADGSRRHLVQPPPVTVTDTTGAGDCFNAGVIAGLLSGEDLPSAVALGCAAGAASTRAPGGTAGAPDLATARDLARHVAIREVIPAPPGPPHA